MAEDVSTQEFLLKYLHSVIRNRSLTRGGVFIVYKSPDDKLRISIVPTDGTIVSLLGIKTFQDIALPRVIEYMRGHGMRPISLAVATVARFRTFNAPEADYLKISPPTREDIANREKPIHIEELPLILAMYMYFQSHWVSIFQRVSVCPMVMSGGEYTHEITFDDQNLPPRETFLQGNPLFGMDMAKLLREPENKNQPDEKRSESN